MKLRYMRYILSFFVLLVLAATNSIAGDILHGPTHGQINILSNEESVVIYRENDGKAKNTAVIFVNHNTVMASLLPGEYVQTKVCMSSIELRVATRGNMTSKGKSKIIEIQNGKTNYIKIAHLPSKTFYPIVVNEAEGQKALKNITTTSNIINRYIPQMTFGTDSLFEFNSAKLMHSTSTALDNLVQDIKSCPNQIKHIKIIGHTDRIGKKAYNQQLSVKRAQAVADYLAKHGVTVPMDVEGRGSREPVTTNCRGKFSPKLIQCLQPDRRVVVQLLNSDNQY